MALVGVVFFVVAASKPPVASAAVRVHTVVRAASPATRILYASDWEGPTQIFAVDPTGRRPLGQVTFGHAPACIDVPYACGFTAPAVSANGKTIAYTDAGDEVGSSKNAYWVASASGRGAHEVAAAPSWYHDSSPYPPFELPGFAPVLVVSPNRRWVAVVNAQGISVIDRRNGHPRLLTSDSTFALSWAPNSKSIAYIHGSALAYAPTGDLKVVLLAGRSRLLSSDSTFAFSWAPNSGSIAYIQGGISEGASGFTATGDLKVVSLTGRSRTLVRADGPYGGQIVALTWTRVPKGTAYRQPVVPMAGLFVGGPVGRLAADGSRVAFAACGNLSVWTPPNPVASMIARLPYVTACSGTDDQSQYYDLAVGGDRVFWGQRDLGQIYDWSLHSRTLSTGESFALADGSSGCSCFDGGGSLAASADLMVFGQWQTALDPSGASNAIGTYKGTTTETLFRGTDAGCPCTAIAYGAAPDTIAPLVPLDTDGSRIALLHYGSLEVIDASGNDLLTTGVVAAGAQIMGNSLVVLTAGRLTEYDISSGAVQHSWPVPDGTPGRDCQDLSEPHCPYTNSAPYTAAVKLQDAARGLVAYTVNGQLHILDVNNGTDKPIGYATEARFMDTGLVYADRARIDFIPFSELVA